MSNLRFVIDNIEPFRTVKESIAQRLNSAKKSCDVLEKTQ